MKHRPDYKKDEVKMSPPVRGRGLKLIAPRFGSKLGRPSPPVRGRGLKHQPGPRSLPPGRRPLCGGVD